ncbi:MAG: hydroxyacylglutathione hydrolase [Candidatus Sericytochromatia bacterium]
MTVVQFSALNDNYNWIVFCEKTKICAGIDIYNTHTFFEFIKENDLNLVAILNTHHHNDHCGGNETIKEKYPDIDFYASKYDYDNKRIPCQNKFLIEGNLINIGEIELQVLELQGHTLGHIAYFNKDIFFAGDTLFASGCGRVFEGSYEQMHNSLEKLLKNLEKKTQIYCGHEYTLSNLKFSSSINQEYFKNYFEEISILREEELETLPTSLDRELNYNPFLMVFDKDKRENILNYKNKTSLEAFSDLRDKKNNF